MGHRARGSSYLASIVSLLSRKRISRCSGGKTTTLGQGGGIEPLASGPFVTPPGYPFPLNFAASAAFQGSAGAASGTWRTGACEAG